MTNRMQWRSLDGADTEKVLHLEIDGQWKPYNTTTLGATLERLGQVGCPRDLKFSKGWHCYQALFKQGWTLIPSPGVIEEDRNIDPLKNVRVWAQANILPENIGFLYSDLMRVVGGIGVGFDESVRVDCICLGYAMYNRSDIDDPTLTALHESLNALVRRTTTSLEGQKV